MGRVFTSPERSSCGFGKARAEKLIGSSLEARVVLWAPSTRQELVEYFRNDLATLFIVSQVEVKPAREGRELQVEVEKTAGDKCTRCWIYHPEVGRNEQHPGLCPKCLAVVTGKEFS